MLDSKAAHLDKEERPEVIALFFFSSTSYYYSHFILLFYLPQVLSLLPPFEGKSVIELGAGIGRFTGELALKAGQLLAVDFIDTAIKKVSHSQIHIHPHFLHIYSHYESPFFRNILQNETINGHHNHVKFLCADVTSPNMSNNVSEGSVDVVFSNWLLMYLSDIEASFVCKIFMILFSIQACSTYAFVSPLMLQVEKLAERMVRWLKDGGYIFFRESCFHQSGDSKRKYNPTHYREPRFYTKVCSLKCIYNLTSLPQFVPENCQNKNELDINLGLRWSVRFLFYGDGTFRFNKVSSEI